MRKLVRFDLPMGLSMSGAAMLLAAGFLAPPPAMAVEPASITDVTGDVIDRNTNDPLPSLRTDIVSASVESGAPGIMLTFRTQEMAAPGTDPNWASRSTFVSWQVDGNGDGKIDDMIRFSADRDNPGGIAGDVTHWSGPGQPAKTCTAPATFDPAFGYRLTIAPDCMGNPAAISYRVQLTYDMKPGESKPPLAFDVLPNEGLAGPVPIAVPTAPAAAPPAPGGPDASAPPAGGQPAPTAPAGTPPAPKATAPAAKPAPKPKATPAPKPTATTRGAAAAAPKPVAPAPAAPATSPDALAATGTSSTRWLGALGGAFLLLGGLGLMTPANRRSRPTVL
jgi:LPXTG-motif cell wall-anchored protein